MINLEIDQVLEMLSNPYRREILRMLTTRERYAFELAKDLNISQRAVTKHLHFLQEHHLITSEKRKSSKGPAREYFKLHQSLVVSLTVAPNLFLTTARPLDETKAQPALTPSLRLNAPEEQTNMFSVIQQGLQLIPEIKDGLDLLQAQQSKLLRGYQGIQNHITDFLQEEGFSSQEIRIIIHLIENEGELSEEELVLIFGEIANVTDSISKLKDRRIIESKVVEKDGYISFNIILNDEPTY